MSPLECGAPGSSRPLGARYPARVPCFRCGKVQTDPVKGKSPWARIVVAGEQVLVCPQCQAGEPHWVADADRCPDCGSPRLMVVMGTVICRACGHDFERPLPSA
jgi:Zn finger protein HypA/HybF involved in hydrogenase expression